MEQKPCLTTKLKKTGPVLEQVYRNAHGSIKSKDFY